MNAPWLEHYDPGIPRSIGTYPEKTLVDVLREHILSGLQGRSFSRIDLPSGDD